MKFWFPLAIDAVIAAIAVFFFFAGLADGSVSSFNIELWGCILLGLGSLLGGSLWFRAKGQRGIALVLVWLLAAPALLGVLLLLAILISNPRWN